MSYNERVKTERKDNVYAYFFYDLNAVYVGRAVNTKRRNWQHRNRNSTVSKFAKGNNADIPLMTILESDIPSVEIGCIKEDYYRKKFEAEGWNVLNKANTGINSSSIGSLGAGKLTKEWCKKCAEKCSCASEFKKKYPSEYHKAHDNSWDIEYTWFDVLKRPKGYWNEETILFHASECESLAEFKERFAGGWDKACAIGIVEKLPFTRKRKPNGYWTYEKFISEAHKYSSLKEFEEKDSKTLAVGKQKGWINDCYWIERGCKPNGYWYDYENCKNAASLCKSRSEFKERFRNAWNTSRKNKWMNEFFPKAA